MDPAQCTAEYWLYYTMADNWKGIFTKPLGKDVPHNSKPDSDMANKDMPDNIIPQRDGNTPDLNIPSHDTMTTTINTPMLKEPLYDRSTLDLGLSVSTTTGSASELFKVCPCTGPPIEGTEFVDPLFFSCDVSRQQPDNGMNLPLQTQEANSHYVFKSGTSSSGTEFTSSVPPLSSVVCPSQKPDCTTLSSLQSKEAEFLYNTNNWTPSCDTEFMESKPLPTRYDGFQHQPYLGMSLDSQVQELDITVTPPTVLRSRRRRQSNDLSIPGKRNTLFDDDCLRGSAARHRKKIKLSEWKPQQCEDTSMQHIRLLAPSTSQWKEVT